VADDAVLGVVRKKSVANGATAKFVAVARLSPAAVARRTASVSNVYSTSDWPLAAGV
jgi:hypothetical protein